MKPTKHHTTYRAVLAAIAAAGTLCLFGCGQKEPEPTVKDPETTPTQISHNHRVINSEDGRRQYRMETPLLERFELAEVPFTEFKKGIKIETFDSALRVESDLVADYARLNEVTEIWEARGNVIAHSYNQERQRTLYTERLYWDQKKKKIYSDTVSRVVDGSSVHIGSYFEADENFETWSFHRTAGQIEVEAINQQDSTRQNIPQSDSTATPGSTAPAADTTRGR